MAKIYLKEINKQNWRIFYKNGLAELKSTTVVVPDGSDVKIELRKMFTKDEVVNMLEW